MLWWKRKSSDPIRAFWVWWDENRDAITQSVSSEEGKLTSALAHALSSRIRDIHPSLAWEIADGTLARHALIVTGEGAPELRGVTERWRRGGPGDSETWEFFAARPPSPQALYTDVVIAGKTLRPLDARFSTEVDAARGRVHVTVWHPQLHLLQEAERLWLAFLLLDWVLGEDDVERWIGEVQFARAELPLDGRGLRHVVTELSRELGEEHWAHLEGVDERGNHLLVELRVPSPRSRYPLFDMHGECVIPLDVDQDTHTDELQMIAHPSIAEPVDTTRAQEIRSSLLRVLGDSGVLVAVETTLESYTLHLYVDHCGVVPDQLQTWLDALNDAAGSEGHAPVRVAWSHDPSWSQIHHLAA